MKAKPEWFIAFNYGKNLRMPWFGGYYSYSNIKFTVNQDHFIRYSLQGVIRTAKSIHGILPQLFANHIH